MAKPLPRGRTPIRSSFCPGSSGIVRAQARWNRARCSLGATVALLALLAVPLSVLPVPLTAESVSSFVPSPNLLTNTTFLQCTNPGIPDHWGVMNGLMGLPGVFKIADWSADSYRTDADAPVPGVHSLRVACKARVQSCPVGFGPKHVHTLSVFLKSQAEKATVSLCIGDNTKTVQVSPRWQRCSFTGRIREYGHWRANCLSVAFIVHGPAAVWLAAPQLERTKPSRAVRAEGWEGNIGADYEVDDKVSHAGARSLRCERADGGDFDLSAAEQLVNLEKPAAGKVVIAGWCKTADVSLKSPPTIVVSLYHERSKDLAKPDQSVSLKFTAGSHDWEQKEMRIDPKVVVTRILVRPEMRGRKGMVWFDDLSIRLTGGGAQPSLDVGLDEDEDEDEEEEDEDEMEEQSRNLLANPGFEKVADREVFLPNTAPSPYCPSMADEFQALLRQAPPPPSITCPAVPTAPDLDGSLEDPVWAKATAIPALVRSADGQPSAAKTECRIMRDREGLYVAFKCTSPKGVPKPRPEGAFDSRNCVAVELKSNPSQKWFYRAAVDASGTRESFCAIDKPFSILTLALQRPKTRKWGWDAPWRSAVKSTPEAWTAEIAIPFSSLRRADNLDEWALNLYRACGDKESSWCPTYRGAWHAGHWSSTFRSKAERFRFGALQGMRGVPATGLSEGLWNVSDLAFQYQPDGTLAALAEITNCVPVPWQQRQGTLQLELTGPAKTAAKSEAPLTLRPGVQVIKVTGLSLKPQHGIYSFKAKLTDSEEGFVLHTLDSWQSVAYGHTCDAGASAPALLFTHTYFPRIYELRAQTEFSYYTDETRARLLVESAFEQPRSLTVKASAREEEREPKEVGKGALAPNGRSVLELDITGLTPGTYRLEVITMDAAGKAQAAALSELVKLPPKTTGTRINRFTGCPWVNGEPRIAHALHMPFSDPTLHFMKGHHFNTLMMGLKIPEQGKDAAIKRSCESLDKLHAADIGVIAWLQGTDADVVRTITGLRDHPAMVAWKIIDEPYGSSKALLARYEAAKRADPYRPAFINWDHWYPRMGGRGTLLASDIGSRDAYPSGASSWVVDLARPVGDMALAFSAMGDDCATYGKGAGFWQQIYGTDDAFREPTPAEIRCFVHLGLIHRVRLTYYFTCIPMYVPLWDAMARVGKDLEILSQQLASREAMEIARGHQGAVHYALWKTGQSKGCLLVCNSGTTDAEFSLPSPALKSIGAAAARRVSNDESVAIADRGLGLRLSPYESRMYILETPSP